ncbi:DUF1499 domain-containing protein [Synechococcus sp. R50.1]|jgi:uncharacterized protein (DUF1499 family)|uniref:DUF1499 domain-containing protein n=1 Tax=Synechococcus sp. R50.1 TaxID=2969649 RepID=UPI0039C1DB8B
MSFWKLLVVIAVLLFGLASGIPTAQAATLGGSPYNRAQQEVVIAASPDQVLKAAEQAFQVWKRGELVSVDAEAMEVKGISRTNFFKFVDDLTVSLSPIEGDPGHTRLHITSEGRVGEYDFGGNRRNINEYLNTLRSLLEQG